MTFTKIKNHMGIAIVVSGEKMGNYHYKPRTEYLNLDALDGGYVVEDADFLDRLQWNGVDVLIYFPEEGIVLSEEDLRKLGEINE